ncbi:hypothetical protein MPTK1_5g10580 [Marchantia polymorpha subsp. ruderalis]|uniref:Uncharacterized protein n=2 Tax=Marchantia polymorpha TaxID=3197 RepID=A0AAF6BH01_MARPO|nr:hypothetical protein MARPO_0048s0014 [Marchantia polymorpha]BBN11285.1 hypothetical protein Mp_5g10580 [Marchantia polymorpha subsp. ruderalis]|eukprot:PTQ38886.1 hypothetical protein MARPO_0048s0014 [Marchantia polymorpha]
MHMHISLLADRSTIQWPHLAVDCTFVQKSSGSPLLFSGPHFCCVDENYESCRRIVCKLILGLYFFPSTS